MPTKEGEGFFPFEERVARAFGPVAPGTVVVVAVSGGADSTAGVRCNEASSSAMEGEPPARALSTVARANSMLPQATASVGLSLSAACCSASSVGSLNCCHHVLSCCRLPPCGSGADHWDSTCAMGAR